jgi:hypothetical protein
MRGSHRIHAGKPRIEAGKPPQMIDPPNIIIER